MIKVLMKTKKIFLKIILPIVLAVFAIFFAYGSFFVWKLDKTEKKIIIDQSSSSSVLDTLKNLTSKNDFHFKNAPDERINILLLGVAGQGKPGQNLTDTIMVLSVNTKTNQVAFLSVPRDLYVEATDENLKIKVNSLFQYGLNKYADDQIKSIEPVKKTLENITSLDINYWAVINFEGFQEIIDAIGGINIINERDIYDPSFPGPNYSYELFELKKGFHSLDGKNALKYARMRHSDPEGDFGRAKRQQQVLQATKNKVFSTGTFLNILKVNELLNALGDNIKTNLDAGELGEFLKLLKKLDTANITSVVIDAWNKDSLLKVSHIYSSSQTMFILIPRSGSWSEVQELSQNIFDLNVLQKRRAEIAAENARVVMINKSGQVEIIPKIQKLLKENFGYKNVVVLSDSEKTTLDQTIACDLTQGQKPFTLDELVKKLPANASYSLDEKYKKLVSNVQADIIILVGKDSINRYNMAEDSFEDYRNAKDTNEYLQ